MVTEGLLLRAKPKPSRTTPVNLEIKFWKKETMVLPFCSNHFFFPNVKVFKEQLMFNLTVTFCN